MYTSVVVFSVVVFSYLYSQYSMVYYIEKILALSNLFQKLLKIYLSHPELRIFLR